VTRMETVPFLSAAPAAEKTGSIALVYGAVFLIALALLVGYVLFEKEKDRKLLLLYICVAVTNLGYLLLSLAKNLPWAMTANRIAYLGAAFTVLLMLLIITDVCGLRRPKWLTGLFVTFTVCAFLVAACGNWKGLYYSHVALETVNGATRLIKTYGPLHILYPIYLYSYVLTMLGVILYAIIRKKISSAKHAMLLFSAVLGNVVVWFVEQRIAEDFEFLSVSLVLSEVILLLLYGMLRDHRRAMEQLSASEKTDLPRDLEVLFNEFSQKVETLSSAERRILNYYIEGYEIADIPELAYISIHTVKKHNRSIYQKLGVSSRDDLMLFIELFRRSGRLDNLMR